MKVFSALISWGIFIAVCVLIYFTFVNFKDVLTYVSDMWHLMPKMSGFQALLFGMAVAFVWVYVLKSGSVKPFNCMTCMSGWFTFFIAVLFHVPFAIFYLFVGVFAGAMFEGIRMRWL